MTTQPTSRFKEKLIAGAAAVAMVFSPMAMAQQVAANAPLPNQAAAKHPLLDQSYVAYRNNLERAVVKVAGGELIDEGGAQKSVVADVVAGFRGDLDAKLAGPRTATEAFLSPKKNSRNMLVIGAVVPPSGLDMTPVPVCAQYQNRVLGAWNIAATGAVTPRPVVPNPEGSTRAACNATLMAAKAEIDQQVGQAPATPPAQPPPVAAATPATPAGVTTLAALAARP